MTCGQGSSIGDQIVQQTKVFGATLAGLARLDDLRGSPSYTQYVLQPYYSTVKGLLGWPEWARTVLVLALLHERKSPELDWWDGRPGNTPGNRQLLQIQKRMKAWLSDNLHVQANSLPYKVEEGGIFLKDSAALAGIGIIGRNNLLLTPDHGARVRLRAMLLDVELPPGDPLEFDPCTACDQRCFRACPQGAFRRGAYERKYCEVQMKLDESRHQLSPDTPPTAVVRYCRACELSCATAQ